MTGRLQGVWPAATTPFDAAGEPNLPALEQHLRWMRRSGCAGVVVLGSLGEASSLVRVEKERIVRLGIRASRGRLLVGISGGSTRESIRLAKLAERWGANGLMVLPPINYRGDREETRAHFADVFESTALPCMLYNNPIAYGTDVSPRDVKSLARTHDNLVAVKESSGDLGRIGKLHSLLGDRVTLFVGLDDQILEGVAAGARGWIAGLANALPRESVALFDLAIRGRRTEARTLYRWFLPLLRLDRDPKLVQLVKLVQEEVGRGESRVRPPRRPLTGEELREARSLIRRTLAARPVISVRQAAPQPRM